MGLRSPVEQRPQWIGQVATRTSIPHDVGDNGTYAIRSFHYARTNITAISVAWAAWHCAPAGASTEVNTTGTLTIKASIETLSGAIHQLRFKGATSIVAASGSTTFSDMTPVKIAAGEKFYIRASIKGSTAISYSPYSFSSPADGDVWAADATDYTTGGAMPADGGSGFTLLPCAIVGWTNSPSIAIIGDSRQVGIQDTPDSTGDMGTMPRAFGATWPYMKLALVGESATDFTAGGAKRLALAQFCTHVIGTHGINDNLDAATLTTNVRAIASKVFPRPYFHQTITPYTSGAWTAVDGSDQTVVISTNRTDFNDLLRNLSTGLPAGFAGGIEAADYVEISRNNNKWKAPGYTGDGLHELQLANKAVIAARHFPWGGGFMPKKLI